MEKSTKIKIRILEVAKNKGISYKNFFNSIGTSYSNFKGKSLQSSLRSEVLVDLSTSYPDVDLHWLITGEHKKEENFLLSEPKANYGLEAEIEHLKELIKAKEETIAVLKQQTGFKESNGKAS